jgi:[pyruvate, water dikinase]-phosphate phosphotransferase / [pyruvate, water dikinase] kinase
MLNIFAISDGTGITAERVVRASLTQFADTELTITRYGNVLSEERIREIVAEAELEGGLIVHTIVSEELRHCILNEGRMANVATIDLMGPLLARLSEQLATQPLGQPGLFNPFDPSYMQRIDAINFTVGHDDGHSIHELDQAEIVLVGVSRTSKTPLSIYLAYRGWKVANVPIVLGIDPPQELLQVPKRKAVALVVKPERLAELRKVRVEHMGTHGLGYADLAHIRAEMTYAYHIFAKRRDWPLVDVTSKPIEEAASEVVAVLGHSMRDEGLFMTR